MMPTAEISIVVGKENAENATPKKSRKTKSKRNEKKKIVGQNETVETAKPKKPKKQKKSIYVSYSSDSSFNEKRFVVDLIQQVKENNLSDDIWFDKDEGTLNDASWLSVRLENVNKCRAAILVVSSSYMSCPVTTFERRIMIERITNEPDETKRLHIFCVILEPVEFAKSFAESLLMVNAELVDLTGDLSHLAVEEKASYAVGALSDRLDKIASIRTPYIVPTIRNDPDAGDDWKRKRVIQWNSNDVIEWLYFNQIREFYRQAFAEKRLDGYLLVSTTDQDLNWTLGIDSKIVRKKISSQLLEILKREEKLEESWHLRCRQIRHHADFVYLIYDPQDARLAANVKNDLSRRGLQVLSHEKLGQSREEFLKLNCDFLAKCSHAICLMTEAASTSPFVLHEVVFSCWLGGGRSIVTLLFSNIWRNLKNTVKAALGDFPAVDFEQKLYSESMDILEHHIKPQTNIAGVVLEQAYLEQMREGVQSLNAFCLHKLHQDQFLFNEGPSIIPKIFISYQWDVQDKVIEIAEFLEKNELPCWSDVTMTPRSSTSRMSIRSSRSPMAEAENLRSHIYRNMKHSSLVICCLTPKYVTCQNCENDLLVANSLGKKVLPIMLQYIKWPPEGISERVRQIVVRYTKPVDLSNQKLFKANLPILLDRIQRQMS